MVWEVVLEFVPIFQMIPKAMTSLVSFRFSVPSTSWVLLNSNLRRTRSHYIVLQPKGLSLCPLLPTTSRPSLPAAHTLFPTGGQEFWC